MKDTVFVTSTGLNIGVLELGDLESSNVVFYCHGFPSCRYEVSFADNVAKKNGLRLIALDRPGYGNSSYLHDRKISDFPKLVCEVADSLGIQSFSVLGVSGGTPYTLACARFIPERLKKVCVVSGVSEQDDLNVLAEMTPINKFMFKSAAKAPFLTDILLAVIGTIWKYSSKFARLWLKTFMSGSDKKILKNRESGKAVGRTNKEAFKQGTKGMRKDFSLMANPWGFSLKDINCPVAFWHGDSDCYVPLAMAQHNAGQIAGATLKVMPGEGHLFIIKYVEEVLAQFNEKQVSE